MSAAPTPKDPFIVWNAVSMAWTEIGLGEPEIPPIAAELRATYPQWDEVRRVIYGDVLGSFALESGLLPLAAGSIIGMFLITPFPDWGYEETYLRRRMQRWYRLPRWWHFLNPIRLIGYPFAILFAFGLCRRLKRAYLSVQP